jgi:hypothetical protein
VVTTLRRELENVPSRVVVADEGDELEERHHLGSGPAIWVVRPDGYIGYRQSGDEPGPVLEWFERVFGREGD